MVIRIYAICCAVACGYEEIYLASMDFTDEKYVYFDKKIKKVGDDENGNTRLHHKSLNLTILDFLQKRYNAKIMSVCPNSFIK